MNPIERFFNYFKKNEPERNMRDVAGESSYYTDLINENKTDETGNPYSFFTKEMRENDDFTKWGSLSDISLINQILKGLGKETPTTDSNYAYGSFMENNGTMLTTEQIKNNLLTGSIADKFDYENLVRKNLITRTDGEIGNYQNFLDNSDSYSVDNSIYDRIRNRKDLERASTTVGEQVKSEDNSGLDGFLAGDTDLKQNFEEINIKGANYRFDKNNGKLLVDATPENFKDFEAQFLAFKPTEYNEYLSLLEQKKKFASINYSDANFVTELAQAERNLFNADGTATLMDDMFADHVAVLKDAAANGDRSYGYGQLTQLGIEFIPGIGMFGLGGITKAAKIVYNGAKIPLEFVTGTTRLSAKTKANLTSKGIPASAIKAIEIKNAEATVMYARNNKPSITKAAPPPYFGKIASQEGITSSAAKTIPQEQIDLITKYRKQGLSAKQIANKPDINYGKTRIGVLFNDLDLFTNVPIKRTDFNFTGTKKDQLSDLAVGNMYVDSITQFLREGDVSLLDARILQENYLSQRGVNQNKLPIIQHGDERSTISNSLLYTSDNIKNNTSLRMITKRNYMLQTLEQDKNFVNYAKKNFDGDTNAALDDIFTKMSTYNKTKGGSVAAENYRTANMYPKINIIEKKFGKQIAAGKYPTLEQLAKALNLPEEEYAQAGRALFRYFDAHKGNLIMPDTYKFTTNSKVADKFDDIARTFRGPEIENFYGKEIYKHYETIASKEVFDKPNALATFLRKYKQDNNIQTGTAVDHVGGLRALSRNNNSPYVAFVQKLPAEINAAKQTIDMAMGSAQKNLKNAWNSKKKWNSKEWAAEVQKITQDYNLKVMNFKRNNPGVEFFEFTLDKNAIPKGKGFQKSFNKNGYGFIVSDTMDVLGKVNIGKTRKFFATGTRDGTLVGDDIVPQNSIYGQYLLNLNTSIDKRLRDQDAMDQILEAPKSMQNAVATTLYDEEQVAFLEEVRQMPNSVRAKLKQKVIDAREVQKSLAESLRDPRPVKYPLSSIPELITDNVAVKSIIKNQMLPTIVIKSFINDLIGKEGPVNAEKIAPNAFGIFNMGPTEATPDESKYIDGIKEFNRALETGVTNIGFNTMDLILGGLDLASFSKFDLSEKLRDLYDEKGVNEPETFVGDMVALLTEFGAPAGLVTKLVTRAQKAMRLNGVNTMTRYLDPAVTGATKRGIQFTNLASRVGTGAVIFGATDFIAGGPYNSLKRMFPDDATLLPGKPERTDDLNGGDLTAANFRNRLRFAADGALIGGLFPLLGPPIYGLVKGTAKLPFKTIPGINRSVVGGGLQLAGVPIRIAADVLAGKVPYTQAMIPAVGKTISRVGEKTASAIQQSAAFVGRNVFARAALAGYDAKNALVNEFVAPMYQSGATFTKGIPKIFGGEGGGLPEFKQWRNFTVNNADPLHANLARIDNKLAMFRDIGKLSKEAFALSTKSNAFIKAKSRTVEKLYKQVEDISFRLAKTFEQQHQKWGQFSTIQKKYLDDVLDYVNGYKKLDSIDPPLRAAAQELKEYNRKLMNEFKDILPDNNKLKTLLTQDIDSQMRKSFAAFTNSNFRPGAENVKAARDYIANFIKQDTSLRAEAKMAFPKAKNIEEAINNLAELKVGNLMHVARYEMEDPIRAFRTMVKQLETTGVKGLVDPLEIFTGQELPAVIRNLMGQEKNLKNSLMQTTGNVIASTQQKEALDRIAKLGLENGWLFNSAEDALTKGKIYNSIPVSDVKGAGFLPSDILGLHGTPEMVQQLSGYSIFDSFLKNKIYQNFLAFKSMVQGGKTLYSPATQMRNFGSASLFAMNVGHIGGNTSVTQNFKIMLDDIFGAGPKVDETALTKFIERKIELGVLDENVVANELGAVLRELKGVRGVDGKPNIGTLNQLTQRLGDTQLTQTVQRLYAGGDNVWKAYGHEFYMSELKQFTKSLDDVSNFFRTQVGREWDATVNGVPKTLAEGIEEMGAHLVRETYPTYSRVPPAIQALRKLPIGNFISFPAEMIRTSLATTSSAMRMISSGNPGLQAMGYRALMGQFTTMYGFNHGAQKLASKMTGIGEDKLRAYQDDLGPEFIDDHILVPISTQNENGTFKVFDASTYNPYNYIVGPVEQFIRELNSTRLDPAQVDSELDRRFFDATGPFMKLLDPFISESIGFEPILDIYARNGMTRDGKKIFSELDSPSDKREKAIYHAFNTLAPGFVRSAGQVYGALTLDTKGGRVMELGDVLIRLMGGSIMTVDPVSALEYKAIDIRKIRGAAFQTEHFFSKTNALSRGPILDEYGRQKGHVMANELRDIQEEAFVAQFGIWKMFHKAQASGLLTEDQIKEVLGKNGRNVPNLKNLLDGEFTPLSFSKEALKKRANSLVNEYEAKGIDVDYDDLYPYYDLLEVIDEFKYRRFEDFLDPARPPLNEIEFDPDYLKSMEISQAEIPVAPLDTSNFVDTQVAAAPKQNVIGANNQQVNNTTGLTRNEEALLSPSDQFYRRSQRGKI